MQTILTTAQFETLSALQSLGVRTGDTFTALEVFPAQDTASLGHRRTLRTLGRQGLLAVLPAGHYRLEPGTYALAGRESTGHLWHGRAEPEHGAAWPPKEETMDQSSALIIAQIEAELFRLALEDAFVCTPVAADGARVVLADTQVDPQVDTVFTAQALLDALRACPDDSPYHAVWGAILPHMVGD